MKRITKQMTAALAALVLLLSLTACGGGDQADRPSGGDGDPSSATSPGVPDTSNVPQGDSTGPDQDGGSGPIVLENFTSGVVFEDGEYYFAINFIERTEEGLVIHYQADSDQSGDNRKAGELSLRVNGVTITPNDLFTQDTFRHIDIRGDERHNGSMYVDGRDCDSWMVINDKWLTGLGIDGIPALELTVRLGSYRSGYGYRSGKEFVAQIFPDAAQDFSFPQPLRESWLLFDNEYGRAQIAGASYQGKDVVLYVLVEGTQAGADAGVQFKIWSNDNKNVSGGMWLTEVGQTVVYQGYAARGNDPESNGYRQPTVTIELINNGGLDTLMEFDCVLDLSGLD